MVPGESSPLQRAPDIKVWQNIILGVLDLGHELLTERHDVTLDPANLGPNPELILATKFCLELEAAVLCHIVKYPGLGALCKEGFGKRETNENLKNRPSNLFVFENLIMFRTFHFTPAKIDAQVLSN